MGSVQIVKASAGSGKTYRLAYEYVRSVIEEPYLYRHILAVTFTNKATEEMKQRILSEINLLAEGETSPYRDDLQRELELTPVQIRERAHTARTRILHDYSHFAILTIDKFFQRIIRSFIKELGVDLNFNLELQTDNLLGKAADNLIEDISVNDALKKWVVDFVEEKIQENKKWDIKTELVRLGKELFKENYRALTRHGENATASKEKLGEIVRKATTQAHAVTDRMQRTARQALEIIGEGGLDPTDFASGRTGFTGYFVKTAAGTIGPYGKRVADALGADEKWYAKTSPHKEDIIALIPRLRPLLEELCRLWDENARFLSSCGLLRENYRNFALLADLSEKIAELCNKENIMPISETNMILHKLIAGNDTPFIFEKAGNHFSRFMIDEFQDTSAMQWENFVPLLQNAVSQSDASPVLLVGDVKQSIYRWRGGDWQILAQDIDRQFGSVSRYDLATNYRSLRSIVEFNNRIVEGCVTLDNDRLDALLDEAGEKGVISVECHNRLSGMLRKAYASHAQKPRDKAWKGYITLTQYRHDENEDTETFPPVIGRIEELQARGYAPSDIAILVRYNAEGVKIANLLLDYKSRHPNSPYSYNVVTAEALTIGAAPVAGFIVACLRLAVNPDDAIRQAVYRRWLNLPFSHPLPAEEAEFIRSLRIRSPQEAFEKILIRYRLAEKREDIAYIQALHEQMIAFSTSTIADLPLFLKWWDDTGASQSVHMPQSRSAITIITVHKAKGLQYKAVLIPYCNWEMNPKSRTILWADCAGTPFEAAGRIPVGFKKEMGESFFAEEYFNEMVLSHIDNINTFYVATTRAEEELHIMMPEAKKNPSLSGSKKISALILDSIALSGETASLGDLSGKVSNTEAGTRIEFGTPIVHTDNIRTEQHSAARYPSRETEAKVRLRMPMQRYLGEEGEIPPLSPRNYGILMHRIFEKAGTEQDIETELKNMLDNGTLTAAEATTLKETIEQAFHNEIVRRWFDSSWETVRNENEIIVPGTPFPRRPDRVMIRGKEAVVVDYKFGLLRSAAHKRQIRSYMHLLRSMGYNDIRGYIWYVSLEDVEQISEEE